MTNEHLKLLNALISLKSKSTSKSENENSKACTKALTLINQSDIEQEEKAILKKAVSQKDNPSGWYYDNNGINAALELLDESYAMALAA